MRKSGKKAAIRRKRVISWKIATAGKEGQFRRGALDAVKFIIGEDWTESGRIRIERRRRKGRVYNANSVKSGNRLLRRMVRRLGRRQSKGGGCRRGRVGRI